MQIANRKIGSEYPPFIIAEAGINYGESVSTAMKMVEVAKECGADCIKFQCHIAEKEMIPTHPMWDIIKQHELSEEDEIKLRKYCDECEIIFLSTPYCKEAVDRLERLGVPAYKIGSGECNNTPLVEDIASKGKPVILSTGMNDIKSIKDTALIFWKHDCPYMLMHCVSLYPTPYKKANLQGMIDLQNCWLPTLIGISDHSVGIYTALGAVALGAVAVEKHFKIYDDCPDSAVSVFPQQLQELVEGSKAIWLALNGNNGDHMEENKTKEWAFHSVVTIRDIKKGDVLGNANIGVKRAGKVGIPAKSLEHAIGQRAKHDIKANTAFQWSDIE